MAKFIVQVVFTDDAERRVATRPTHRVYLRSLFDSGKLHESGPFMDDTGALIIYEAADRAEAEALLAADPYSQTGGIIASATISEWNRVFPPVE